jgi:hypothetical protein
MHGQQEGKYPWHLNQNTPSASEQHLCTMRKRGQRRMPFISYLTALAAQSLTFFVRSALMTLLLPTLG